MANYLVTGGAGFIGSNLVTELVERGESVRVLDDFSTGRHENLAEVADKIELITGSITDPDLCHQACQDQDFILHKAAIASVPASVDDPVGTHGVNVTGTLNILTAAAQAGCRRLVFAASCAVYGNRPETPKTELHPVELLTPYAAQKLAGEAYCQAFAHSQGLSTVCLRYFNVFGPRQNPDSQYGAVIPNFMSAVAQGQAPTIFGDGLQTRDFVPVQNVVQANLLAATSESISGQGEVFNIGTGEETSLLDLMAAVNTVFGHNLQPVHEPGRVGDVARSCADISKARKLLGYQPGATLAEGLESMRPWFEQTVFRHG